jgi:hypothetical protein
MASDLSVILHKIAEEDYKSEKIAIEEGLRRYKILILQIAKVKKWDLLVWAEGAELKDLKKYEKDLNLLERSNLIKGEMKYTERDAYRQYQLTKKGSELAKKLLNEP